MNQLLKTDAYKLHHRKQYPKNTKYIYANLTARNSDLFNQQYGETKSIITYGLHYITKKIREEWNENFFKLKWKKIEKELFEFSKGTNINILDNISYYKQLHEFGKLPIRFNLFKEDYTSVKLGSPIMTFWNTNKRFFWLVNYIETWLLSEAWALITSANIAYKFYRLGNEYLLDTKFDKDTIGKDEFLKEGNKIIEHQFHDFSYRGINSTDGAIKTGLGHLAFFKGTDNLPALYEKIKYWKDLPNNNKIFDANKGNSVVATEHSVMMSYQGKELNSWKELLKLYPTGIISIVADTYDYHYFINDVLPQLKDDILARDGKVVIRPDSGNPIEIIEFTIKKLDELFGHSLTVKGFKEINHKVGLIYGDGINYHNAKDILEMLKQNGYASTNIVFGIGSYNYQYITRDLFSFAIKTTAININNEWYPIAKNVKTDINKKSLEGFIGYYYDKKEQIWMCQDKQLNLPYHLQKDIENDIEKKKKWWDWKK